MLRNKMFVLSLTGSLLGVLLIAGPSPAAAGQPVTIAPAVYRTGDGAGTNASVQQVRYYHGRYGYRGGYRYGGGFYQPYYGYGAYRPAYPIYAPPVYAPPLYAPPVYAAPPIYRAPYAYPAYGYGYPGYGVGVGVW